MEIEKFLYGKNAISVVCSAKKGGYVAMNLFQLRKRIELQTGKPLPSSQIADDLEISRQQYWLYEKGKREIGAYTALRMTEYFRQWLPDLTLEEMILIIKETRDQAKGEKEADRAALAIAY
jgi:transcriptional regulator with XRE-family HTH domain